MHVFGQVLGHLLGQHGDQGAVALGRHVLALGDHVVDLAEAVLGHRADLHRRVDQAGGADHLLGEHPAGLLHLPLGWGGRDIDAGRAHGLPLLELERAVVEAGGQAEAVFGQGELAPVVAPVHGADLRHGLVTLVDE